MYFIFDINMLIIIASNIYLKVTIGVPQGSIL